MNEVQLRVAIGIIAEPEKNRLDIENRLVREEVQRIIRIINISKNQKKTQGQALLLKSLANIIPVHSIN